jgi:hypothetical protein
MITGELDEVSGSVEKARLGTDVLGQPSRMNLLSRSRR